MAWPVRPTCGPAWLSRRTPPARRRDSAGRARQRVKRVQRRQGEQLSGVRRDASQVGRSAVLTRLATSSSRAERGPSPTQRGAYTGGSGSGGTCATFAAMGGGGGACAGSTLKCAAGSAACADAQVTSGAPDKTHLHADQAPRHAERHANAHNSARKRCCCRGVQLSHDWGGPGHGTARLFRTEPALRWVLTDEYAAGKCAVTAGSATATILLHCCPRS
jgi:hypothetical protein